MGKVLNSSSVEELVDELVSLDLIYNEVCITSEHISSLAKEYELDNSFIVLRDLVGYTLTTERLQEPKSDFDEVDTKFTFKKNNKFLSFVAYSSLVEGWRVEETEFLTL